MTINWKRGVTMALGVASALAATVPVPTPALAENKIIPPATARALLEFSIPREGKDQGPSSPTDRVRFATALSELCRSYRGIVRTITPDERAWLEKEIGPDSSSERAMAALGTEIFSREQSTRYLDRCISITRLLTSGTDHPALWAELAQHLISQDMSDALSRVGAQSPDQTDIDAANMLFQHSASAIIGRILTPALLK